MLTHLGDFLPVFCGVSSSLSHPEWWRSIHSYLSTSSQASERLQHEINIWFLSNQWLHFSIFLPNTNKLEGRRTWGRENKVSVLKNSVVKRFNSLQDRVGSCMKSTWTTWNSDQLLDIAVYCRVGKEHWQTNEWYNFQILLDTYVS